MLMSLWAFCTVEKVQDSMGHSDSHEINYQVILTSSIKLDLIINSVKAVYTSIQIQILLEEQYWDVPERKLVLFYFFILQRIRNAQLLPQRTSL